MIYPVVLHRDRKSGYAVRVPDLAGCVSVGMTFDDALLSCREAIEQHLERLIDDGQAIPAPSEIEGLQGGAEFKNGIWALVRIDEATLRVKAVRINITLPERVLDAVDDFAKTSGDTRSGLLAKAAIAFIGRESELPESRRGRPPEKRRAPKVAPTSSKTASRVDRPRPTGKQSDQK